MFPLAFLAAHIVVTVAPFPRTAFTLAAGLLFGPALGIALAVVASTVSALIALLLVRHGRVAADPPGSARGDPHGGRALAGARLGGHLVAPVDARRALFGDQLRRRASAVRLLPYTVATVIGLIPGTAAVVVLGDALTGHVSPLLYAVSACTGALGLTGLIMEISHYRRQHRSASPDGP